MVFAHGTDEGFEHSMGGCQIGVGKVRQSGTGAYTEGAEEAPSHLHPVLVVPQNHLAAV